MPLKFSVDIPEQFNLQLDHDVIFFIYLLHMHMHMHMQSDVPFSYHAKFMENYDILPKMIVLMNMCFLFFLFK